MAHWAALAQARQHVLDDVAKAGKAARLRGFERISAVHLDAEPFSVRPAGSACLSWPVGLSALAVTLPARLAATSRATPPRQPDPQSCAGCRWRTRCRRPRSSTSGPRCRRSTRCSQAVHCRTLHARPQRADSGVCCAVQKQIDDMYKALK